MGKGKYDYVLTNAVKESGAQNCMLIFLDGKHGEGMAARFTYDKMARMPGILRKIADDLEKSIPSDLESALEAALEEYLRQNPSAFHQA